MVYFVDVILKFKTSVFTCITKPLQCFWLEITWIKVFTVCFCYFSGQANNCLGKNQYFFVSFSTRSS